jgi:hypothetical protein
VRSSRVPLSAAKSPPSTVDKQNPSPHVDTLTEATLLFPNDTEPSANPPKQIQLKSTSSSTQHQTSTTNKHILEQTESKMPKCGSEEGTFDVNDDVMNLL